MLQTSMFIILNLWYSTHSYEWSSFSKLFYIMIYYLSPCFRFKKSCGISCWHTDPNKPVISNLSVFFLERMIFPAWKSEQSWIQINKMDAWMILLQLNTTVFCKAIFAYHSENLMEYSNTLDFYIVSLFFFLLLRWQIIIPH